METQPPTQTIPSIMIIYLILNSSIFLLLVNQSKSCTAHLAAQLLVMHDIFLLQTINDEIISQFFMAIQTSDCYRLHLSGLAHWASLALVDQLPQTIGVHSVSAFCGGICSGLETSRAGGFISIRVATLLDLQFRINVYLSDYFANRLVGGDIGDSHIFRGLFHHISTQAVSYSFPHICAATAQTDQTNNKSHGYCYYQSPNQAFFMAFFEILQPIILQLTPTASL